MTVKKVEGGYLVDIRPAGRKGPHIRRKFRTRREAKEAEAALILGYQAAPGRFEVDRRNLSVLAKLWYKRHGVTLKDAKYRYARLLAVIERLGDPEVSKFTADDFTVYRLERLAEGVSVSTVNHETRYLRAMFNELLRLGLFHGVNPIASVRTFREKGLALSFLEEDEIELLLRACDESRNTHCGPVARLCLATGARWNEANELRAESLFPDRVVFVDTKNGADRVVPIASEFSKYLRSVGFPVRRGRLFDGAQGAFRSAVKRSGLEFPKGQLTHILRHTFASHFMMKGGNILTLQKVLGHSDLKVTMRYAHLSPDYMREVVDLGLACVRNVCNESLSISGR